MKRIVFIAFTCVFSSTLGFPSLASIVAAGAFHSLVCKNGTVWTMGYNQEGQLGLGDTKNRSSPEQLQLPDRKPIQALAAGDGHSILLNVEGNVWVMGDNEYGQLGLGDTNKRSSPEQLKLPDRRPIQALAAGGNHSILLGKEGDVWVMGQNQHGQLGLGDAENRSAPVQILSLPPIRAVAAGEHHSILLGEEGNVWVMGQNQHGQLGLGDTKKRSAPERLSSLPCRIKAVAAGYYHSLLLGEDGIVWAMGWNRWRQLELNDSHIEDIISSPVQINDERNHPIVAIAAGKGHNIFIDNESRILTFGFNEDGQLGGGNESKSGIVYLTLPEPGSRTGEVPQFDSPAGIEPLPAGEDIEASSHLSSENVLQRFFSFLYLLFFKLLV